MIEVNVNVRLSASPELSAFIAGLFNAPSNVAAAVEPEKKTRQRTVKESTAENTETAPVETTATETTATEPELTEEQLRAIVQGYSTQGKEQRENVKSLLATYGVSRIADVPADKRNEFKAKIEAL